MLLVTASVAQDIELPRSTKQLKITMKCPNNTYWRAWKTVPEGNLIITCGTIPTEKAIELKSR